MSSYSAHDSAPNNDTDGDGLADGEEAALKADWPCLDPLAWDSDGDMLPDGWEVLYASSGLGLSPCQCAATNSPAWDADNDGLGLFDEYRYCTDPFNPDTDGDGVRDGDEVPHSPGSCPSDPDDNGDPANCVTLKLTVGDPSGSQSERWNLDVFEEATGRAVYHHCDRGFGSPGSTNYALVKGKAYTFSLKWVATNRGDYPDYDWRALINDSTAAGARSGLYGTGAFIVEDPDELLQHEEHGDDTDITIGKEGKIIVPKVDFEEAPNQNYGFDPDGPWVSVEKTKTTTVKVNISPSSAASQVYFTSSDASKVTVSPSRASGSPQILTLTAGALEGDSAVIEARIGSATGQSCTNLGVAVYEKKSISCFVHKVNGYSGLTPLTQINDLLKQAVVRIDTYSEDARTCDLSSGYTYDVDEAEDEHIDLANTGLSPGWADVFVIPSPGKVRTDGGAIKFGMHYHDKMRNVHWNIVSETADPFYRYFVHELFHYWQTSHESDSDNLMRSDVSGERLKKAQWDLTH